MKTLQKMYPSRQIMRCKRIPPSTTQSRYKATASDLAPMEWQATPKSETQAGRQAVWQAAGRRQAGGRPSRQEKPTPPRYRGRSWQQDSHAGGRYSGRQVHSAESPRGRNKKYSHQEENCEEGEAGRHALHDVNSPRPHQE